MIDKDDWRLLNDNAHLKGAYLNPTDGEEICENAPHLKRCAFCWESVKSDRQYWFVPSDCSCCICDECLHDFKEAFSWKILDGWDLDWSVYPSGQSDPT